MKKCIVLILGILSLTARADENYDAAQKALASNNCRDAIIYLERFKEANKINLSKHRQTADNVDNQIAICKSRLLSQTNLNGNGGIRIIASPPSNVRVDY